MGVLFLRRRIRESRENKKNRFLVEYPFYFSKLQTDSSISSMC